MPLRRQVMQRWKNPSTPESRDSGCHENNCLVSAVAARHADLNDHAFFGKHNDAPEMRKLIVSMNVTLDGFMAGPDCELDWHFSYWNDEMADYAARELSKADSILLGRVTYCAMAKYWPARSRDFYCPRQDIAFADMMNNYQKIVFSKTLRTAEWNNSAIIRDDIGNAVARLKRAPGKSMMTYGSGQMVTSLMARDLVDDFQLWIHPVTIGKGKRFFRSAKNTHRLSLLQTKTFTSGVILLHYTHSPGTSNHIDSQGVVLKDIVLNSDTL